jgi:hypothetical protein
MARRQRECYLCGQDYQYCGTCYQDRLKPAWMAEFHSESCKDIFDICTRFNLDMMSKADAQKALKKCDLTNRKNFKFYVQHDLEVIFGEDPVAEEEAVAYNAESHEVVITEDE